MADVAQNLKEKDEAVVLSTKAENRTWRGTFCVSSAIAVFALGAAWHEGLKLFPRGAVRSGFVEYVPWMFPKNESVWAHQLIFAWPFLGTSLLLFTYKRKFGFEKDVSLSRAAAFAFGLFLVPTLFLWYTGGVVENASLVVDVLIFAIACFSAEYLFWRLSSIVGFSQSRQWLGYGIFVVVFLVFIVGFSYADFHHSLFEVH